MSHLRAPATRADRREGGRHGRPVARPAPALPETHIRPQLMRLAVLPPLAVALSATAAVLFSIRSGGVHTGPTLWAVLAGAVSVAVAGILIAAVAADRAARSVSDRVDSLRRTAARGETDLDALVDALRQGGAPPQLTPRRRPPPDADDFDLLAADLARAHDGAVTAVVRAAQLSSQAGSEQKLEVFVNLARRLQSLVHREISILDELENEIEDPDLLKGLFHVDHLATRIRRHAENLAVLGGAVSRRQWSNPVSMTEVLRSAIAEVEQYSRVKLVPPIDGELRGHAVADVIHLLAELVENATVFSAPQTQVLLRANLVTSGLAVEVEDRGLGMPVAEQHRMNTLLADPDQVNVASLLADGRIGLYVVSQLARRHGITVRLQSNIYGGVQAVLVVPQALLGTAPTVLADGAGEAVPPPRAQAPLPAPSQATALPAGADAHGRPVPDAAAGPPSAAGTGPAPGTGRRRHAQRGPARRGAESPAGRRDAERDSGTGATRRAAGSGEDARTGDGPAPLPVRGARATRPNPAEAVPGVSPEDRSTVEAHAGILPTPRSESVPDTLDKPRLPRRRAQEHLVPQLRGGPAPRQTDDTGAGHDPGLMAAFRRGIGLAEAQQPRETGHDESPHAQPVYGETAVAESPYGRPAFQQSPHADAATTGPFPMVSFSLDAAHMADGHLQSAPAQSTELTRARPEHGVSDHQDADHMSPGHMAPDHTAQHHMSQHHMSQDHMAENHMAENHMVPGATSQDHTAAGHTPAGHAPADPTHPDHKHQDHKHPDYTSPGRTTPASIPPARAHEPAFDGTRGTGRADGSAPAG
ncbi:ATP-binding protein [Streptomyces sp. NPDC014846]|uniref:ATP-binding protein n=1 Tax=Streptomyces sp. NPDC014846 TaxID=3364922 RepID=UPI003701D114